MAEKLYGPNELELVLFLRDSESYISVDELFKRAKQLGVVEGEAQADHLWDNRDDFPDEWKLYFLVVPEHGSRVLLVFFWHSAYERWFRCRGHPGKYLHDFDRLLRPRE